jgi:hypothetical protein
MNISVWISIAALVISLTSLVSSIYFNSKERASLKTTSVLYRGDDEIEPKISVSAVNAGRRPLVLRMLVGTDDAGEWVGTYMGDKEHGKRLGEHERFELTLTCSDLGFFHEEIVEFTELWFEDSIGRRHRIKDSRRNIEQFRVVWKKFNLDQQKQREIRNRIAAEVKAALSLTKGDGGN